MSCKYWLLLGSLALGAAPTVACSSKFSSCEARRTCASGGTSGTAGAAGASTDGGEAGAPEAGSAGADAQAGNAGTSDDAGSGGTAGDANVDTELAIAAPTLTAGKTYVPFSAKLHASGAAQYSWSLTSGTLPAGLALQDVQSATLTIVGTASEAGQFPITVSVTDGSLTKSIDVTLVVTHSALFLSDRNTAGVNELFLAEIGGESAAAPVRLSASLPAGGSVSSYAWSPDGSKVLYLATQSAGGAAELWVASLASPGTAQRVSTVGLSVSQIGWLGAGNIAAYATSTADAYLVDLSAATPEASKLAVAGSTISDVAGLGVSNLLRSPNGRSITFTYFVPMVGAVYAFEYVTWESGSPKSVRFGGGAGGFYGYSHDGRFASVTSSGIGSLVDLSTGSPVANSLGPNFSSAWSPDSQLLLYYGDWVSSDDPAKLKLGSPNVGTLTSTLLVPSSACKGIRVEPWSADGKNCLFSCGRDVRGISNVATAGVSSDFSLLPNGFLSNAFTDAYSISWSPNSEWVSLRADRELDGRFDLHLIRWSAPGTAYKPHSNTIGSGVSTWAFAQNSQSVALVGSIAPQSNAGLYLTTLPATGAPPTATLVSSPASAVVQTDINWLPGSRVLTYRATVSGAAQLFALPVAADGTAGTPVSISGPSGSGVTSYQLAPTR